MEEKRINDDVELYLASDEPVEADNEPATEEPTVEPISAKKYAPKVVRVGEVPEFRERNKKNLNYFLFHGKIPSV